MPFPGGPIYEKEHLGRGPTVVACGGWLGRVVDLVQLAGLTVRPDVNASCGGQRAVLAGRDQPPPPSRYRRGLGRDGLRHWRRPE